jgi:DNA-binding response OmpR family regulator
LRASRFEIVVPDLGSPDADGLDVLGEMRRRQDTTSVLVLTARGSLEDRVMGLQSGADDGAPLRCVFSGVIEAAAAAEHQLETAL